MSSLQLGLIDVGKIVRDQHLSAIRQTPAFRLADAFSQCETTEALIE